MKFNFRFIILSSVLLSLLSVNCYAFSDVSEDDWFYSACEYVASEGIFSGTSETTFSPDDSMTRGMFITALGRIALAPSDFIGDGIITASAANIRSTPSIEGEQLGIVYSGNAVDIIAVADDWYKIQHGVTIGYVRGDLMTATVAGFSDVDFEAYYAPYISWACSAGIASGYSSAEFSPNSPITREEICTYLANYAEYCSFTLPITAESISFTDEDMFTNPDAIYALGRAGVINGRDDGSFDPSASASRCEVAVMFQRFGALDVPVVDSSNAGYSVTATVPSLNLAVDSSYFDDACFIGHSLVVGMNSFFNLPSADYYAVSGISASKLLEYERFSYADTAGSIGNVLQSENYGKVYIMLGVNELGPLEYHANTYYNSMLSLIDIVQSSAPNATIYLIGITPVTQELSEKSDNFNRENVVIFNSKLQEVATQKNVYYLDTFGLFADENGYISADKTATDGLHILQDQYTVLKDYIMTHTA